MKHPALARVFAVVLAVLSLILLMIGLRGLGKNRAENAERLAYSQKLRGRIDNYQKLSAELDNAADYQETMAALNTLITEHERTASKHKTDTAVYSATKGGLTMGENLIVQARAEMEDVRRQLKDANSRHEYLEGMISQLLDTQRSKLPCLETLANCAGASGITAYNESSSLGIAAIQMKNLIDMEPIDLTVSAQNGTQLAPQPEMPPSAEPEVPAPEPTDPPEAIQPENPEETPTEIEQEPTEERPETPEEQSEAPAEEQSETGEDLSPEAPATPENTGPEPMSAQAAQRAAISLDLLTAVKPAGLSGAPLAARLSDLDWEGEDLSSQGIFVPVEQPAPSFDEPAIPDMRRDTVLNETEYGAGETGVTPEGAEAQGDEAAYTDYYHAMWEKMCRDMKGGVDFGYYSSEIRRLSASLSGIVLQANSLTYFLTPETGGIFPGMEETVLRANLTADRLAVQGWNPAELDNESFLTLAAEGQETLSELSEAFMIVSQTIYDPSGVLLDLMDKLQLTDLLVKYLEYTLSRAEQQIQGQLEQLWYKMGETEKDKLKLEAEKLGLDREAQILARDTLDAEELKDLRNRCISARQLLLSVPEIKSASEETGDLTGSAERYLLTYGGETDRLFRGRSLINILSVAGGVMGIIAAPAAYELIKKRFMLLAPVLLCLLCSAGAEAVSLHLGIRQQYAAMAVSIFALIQLMIVLPKKKKPAYTPQH